MGGKLPLIECQGDPRQMGRQQGEMLRQNINDAIEAVGNLEAFRLMKPKWLPASWFPRLAARKAHRFMRRAFQNSHENFEQRFLGICEGSQVQPENLALCCSLEAAMSDLTRSSHQSVNALQAGCSAIAATGSASRGGDAIVMHNFDHVPVVQKFLAVRRSKPVGKLSSVEFTLSPLLGAVDGVNEAGLGVTCNYAYVRDSITPGPTITMLISRVLAEAESVGDAIECLQDWPRVGGGLLMLADSAGEVVSIELSNRRMAVRHPCNGIIFHTNRLQCDSMRSVEIATSACYDHRAPSLLRGQRVHDSADLRSDAIAGLVMENGPLSLENLKTVLSDHAHGESCNSVCMHGGYWSTVACTQLLPRDRKLRVAFSNTCQATLQDFFV